MIARSNPAKPALRDRHPGHYDSARLPSFTLRGHAVEEFIGVVRRYGAAAAGVQAMIDAAAEGPTIAAADIDFACGNCAK